MSLCAEVLKRDFNINTDSPIQEGVSCSVENANSQEFLSTILSIWLDGYQIRRT